MTAPKNIISARSATPVPVAVAFFVLLSSSTAFSPSTRASIRTSLPATQEPLQLTNNLSPSKIANLASTPNRSETKSGTWIESIQANEKRTRYIVEGEGSITLTNANGETTRQRINPGSLVEITGVEGESQLMWDVDDEMTILYSGEMFNEQQYLAIGLIILLVGTIAYFGMGT